MSLLLLACSFLHLTSALSSESFTESLSIRPTQDAKLVTTFTFKTLIPSVHDEDDAVFYTLFPLSLGQILRVHEIPEMHLTINSGNWDYQRWGYEPDVGNGGDVWAWMAGVGNGIDDRWIALQNSLAGLFCTSLSPLSQSQTSTSTSLPVLTFPPTGILPPPTHTNGTSSYHLRRTTLPSERLCTENLTPFLKLLPCKGLAGLAQLLSPHSVVGANWHGMGIHVRRVEKDDGMVTELKLVIRAVFDTVRLNGNGKRDWTFKSLFNREVTKSCPAAAESDIWMHLPDSSSGQWDVSPSTSRIGYSNDVHLNLSSAQLDFPLNLALTYREGQFSYDEPDHSASSILVQRSLISPQFSQVQTHGRLRVRIQNFENATKEVLYTEVVPWFLQLYLHTMDINPKVSWKLMDYTPSPHPHTLTAPNSKKPSHLTLLLQLPPNSVTTLLTDVDFAFLRYTEYVPDAQRGIDVPGGVLRVVEEGGRVIHTPSLLISLPTPDFSMPYNVIMMSSTVVGFMFANTFNMLMRKVVWVRS